MRVDTELSDLRTGQAGLVAELSAVKQGQISLQGSFNNFANEMRRSSREDHRLNWAPIGIATTLVLSLISAVTVAYLGHTSDGHPQRVEQSVSANHADIRRLENRLRLGLEKVELDSRRFNESEHAELRRDMHLELQPYQVELRELRRRMDKVEK